MKRAGVAAELGASYLQHDARVGGGAAAGVWPPITQ